MSWCEAEEPRGVSPARHGKSRGTHQLKPPAEQIIHPNPVTFAYLIVLFTWLAYHLVERVCSAGKKEFCLLWLFLWSICAHSLPAALWVWTVPRQQYKQQPFGRCMGSWAGHCISKESLVWKSEFLLGLIAQCHNLWLFQAAQSCVSGFTFRLWFMSLYGVELRTTCCLQFFLLLQRGV